MMGRRLAALWTAQIRRRLKERQFWIIQAGVLSVTLLHGALELAEHRGQVSVLVGALKHFPVSAYIIPVVYAGLRYGLHGGMFTAILIGMLTIPNILIFHREGLEWLGEAVAVLFVVAVGFVFSVVVEREVRALAETEAANRRLTLLNEITATLTRLTDPQNLLDSTLDALVGSLAFGAARFVPVDGEGFLSPVERGTQLAVAGFSRQAPVSRGEAGATIPVTSETQAFGTLLVAESGGSRLSDRDVDLLTAAGRELGIALDNARLREVQEASKQTYIRELTRAQEEERRRIARELHDGAAQSLVHLSRGLAGLVDVQGLSDGAVDRVESLQRTTLETLEAIRRVSQALRPAVLDDLGLVPAIDWLVNQLAGRSGLETDFLVDGESRRVSPEAELVAFRVAQEALHNTETHAQAAKVAVALTFKTDTISLEIKDDGRGFDPDEMTDVTTLGLTGMRERADLVGGQLTIETKPGGGTAVRLDVQA
jgi:signal transduction histidine kinase